MIRLIATDMDGTFLDSQKKFDKSFIDLFYQMKEKNIKFVIASGNQYYRLYQKFLPLSDQMYFIAENGSYIAKGTTELHCDVISYQKVKEMVHILSQYQRIFIILCGRKGAYILKDYFAYKNEVKKYYCAYSFIDSYDEIHDDIMKIAIYDKEQHIQDLLDEIRQQLPDGVKIVTSGNEWMDIQNQHMHKGVGIKFLQDTYQINPDECAAFGDQMNDYEMLQEVKYAYAMSNAVEPIKNIAYEVIGSNDEQAVLKKIHDILEETEVKMKKVEFERMQSVTVGFGGIKGSKYQFEGIEEKVKQRILDGWTYLGYVPIITRSTGDVETISLIKKKEETA